MRMSDMFPAKYLKKEDFDAPTVLTIKNCAVEEVGKNDAKPVMYFNERVKGLVLNKTKASLLSETFGDDSDAWVGRKVRLSSDPSVRDLAGKIVGGIRLECSKAAAPVKAAPVTITPAPAGEFQSDDQIPF